MLQRVMTADEYPYPENPPLCQQPETLAQRCPDCIFEPCGYLAVAQQLQNFGEQITARDHEMEVERQRHARRMEDRIIPGFLAAGGIEYKLDTEPAFASEIAEGNWTGIIGDIRGLKFVNDNLGYPAGDNLLHTAGKRLLQVRQRQDPGRPKRRKHPDIQDVGFREASSDELGIIVRQVTPRQGTAVLKRITERFSLQGAINDDREGRLPILGTFMSAHASSIHVESNRAPLSYTARNLFYGVVGAIRQQLHVLANGQYDAMWGRVCETFIMRSKPIPPRPEDPRTITAMFTRHCLPNYNKNQASILKSAGPFMGEA